MSDVAVPDEGPECCADESNLEVQPSDRPDLTIRRCRACGRRHFEVEAEPFQIGVKPS